MFNCRFSHIFMTSLILLLMTISILAEVPQIINYQGRLTDNFGNPITGYFTINFKIYNHNDGGDSLWSSGDQLVQVTDGLFSYELGSAYPIPENIFNEHQLYLSIHVAPDLEVEVSRTQLITVPYAFNAIRADTAYIAGNAVYAVYADTALYVPSVPDTSFGYYSLTASDWYRDDTVLNSYLLDAGILDIQGPPNYAPVHLPNGAMLTRITAHYYAGNAVECQFQIRKFDFVNSSIDTLASRYVVLNASEKDSLAMNSFSDNVIDNINSSYYLYLWTNAHYQVRLYGVRIEYIIIRP